MSKKKRSQFKVLLSLAFESTPQFNAFVEYIKFNRPLGKILWAGEVKE